MFKVKVSIYTNVTPPAGTGAPGIVETTHGPFETRKNAESFAISFVGERKDVRQTDIVLDGAEKSEINSELLYDLLCGLLLAAKEVTVEGTKHGRKQGSDYLVNYLPFNRLSDAIARVQDALNTPRAAIRRQWRDEQTAFADSEKKRALAEEKLQRRSDEIWRARKTT